MIADSELICALSFFNQRAEVKAWELAWITQFSVFKFALELEKYYFTVFRSLLYWYWDWFD